MESCERPCGLAKLATRPLERRPATPYCGQSRAWRGEKMSSEARSVESRKVADVQQRRSLCMSAERGRQKQ